MRTRLLALVALALLLLALPAQAATTTVTGKDKGGNASVHVGDTVHVSLSSTVWTIEDAHGSGLAATGPTTTTFVAGPTCRPGSGCGTTDRSFRATSAGTATLVATRTQCGEALRCTGDNGRWSTTVRVLTVTQPQKLPFTGAPVGLLALLALALLAAGAVVTRAGGPA